MRWDPDSRTFITDTRRYLRSQGTFGGRDPLGTGAYATQGMNLGQFEGSKPVSHVDPTGLWDDGVNYNVRPLQIQFDSWVQNYRKNFGSDPDYGQGGEGLLIAQYYKGLIAQAQLGHRGHSDFPGNEDFDYTRPDHFYGGLGPYWDPAPHFEGLAAAEAQAATAAANCDKNGFADALHYGQDAFSHNAGGYFWDPSFLSFGHFLSPTGKYNIPGHTPDNSRLHPLRYAAASRWTEKMLKVWDSKCTRCGKSKQGLGAGGGDSSGGDF